MKNIDENISILKRNLLKRIDSLGSPIKTKLFSLFKSARFREIKSLADRAIDNTPPYDPTVQLIKDIKTLIEIKKISKELEEMKKRGEID